jgi:3-isopropylmalate dehydrogenase
MYEPISGTAPDIAGKGIANPTAAILSASMLLEYSLGDPESARRIVAAIEAAFRLGARTIELAPLGSKFLTTGQFTDFAITQLAG